MAADMIAEPALIEAIMHTRAQVDFLWQFFVTVLIAIFALFFVYDDKVALFGYPARVAAILGISAFAYINGKALINTYGLLDAFLVQYRADYGSQGRFEDAFFQRFVLLDHDGRPNMVWFTHSFFMIVVIVSLLARELLHLDATPRERKPTVDGR